MCGIAGIVTREATPRAEREATVRAMADRLRHRGPDDAGVWSAAEAGVAFAHRRLSIVDLSPAGHQPMISASGRYVICFNGEIYNFTTLRRELESDEAPFRGTSDTEVLLAAFERWGVGAAIERAIGMFALAVWDAQERVLSLARDRMGEKPLLVARLPWGLAFASELRAFPALRGWSYDVDRSAIASLVASGYIVEGLTVDRKVVRLPAAGLATIGYDDIAAGRTEQALSAVRQPRRYWSLRDAIAAETVPTERVQAVERLEGLLKQCLEGQRVADVPLGAFLSGGIDSSVVTGVLQSISREPVRTFSIGFEDGEYDESGFARAVAHHLGTVHTEFRVSAGDALAVVDRLADVYDEPLADPSQVPTILVSRLARQAVTVCLSGDGGDEVFGGYNRYFWSGRWGRRFQGLPRPVRAVLNAAATTAVAAVPDSLVRRVVLGHVGGGGAPLQDPRGKLRKALEMLRIDDPVERYLQLTRIADPGQLVAGSPAHDRGRAALQCAMDAYGEVFGAMVHDIDGYLPGDQLARVDRASMAVSLEMRAPLLDHRIVAFGVAATRAFGDMRLAARPKWLLREVLYRHVPPALVERPKMGFSIPLSRWLRLELRDWVESLLTPAALRNDGFFHADAVRLLWDEHRQGRADHSRALWSVLMFQQWWTAAQSRRTAEPAAFSVA